MKPLDKTYTMRFSLHNKKAVGLAAAFGFVDFLLLVLVQDAEVGAPAQELFGGEGGANCGKTQAQLLGDAKLEHEPVVFTQFGG
jgi:hypothetical protein